MKSTNIGKEINGFLILDCKHVYNGKRGWTAYNTKCLKCGNEDFKSNSTVLQGTARCKKCSSKHEYHNQSKNRIYHIYHSMISRCYSESNIRYNSYGGKGVTVCNEWLNSFKAFYNWAMLNGYSEELSIDRIDVNGNYEPSNCRWATVCEQMNNTTRNHYLEYNGKRQTVAQWAKETGLPYYTILQRVDKLNWNVERALTTPKRERGKYEMY